MESWNQALFLMWNAGADAWPFTIFGARLLAEAAPVLAAGLLVLLWVRRPVLRMSLLEAFAVALLALGLAQAITHFWYHPRPFEIGLGHQWMAHAPEASFPSDHATLLFSLALPLLALPRARAWGVIFLGLALGTAWARVYLGVHFPFDMAGGLLTALVAFAPVRALAGRFQAWVFEPLIRLYLWLLEALHLPTAVFPRK